MTRFVQLTNVFRTQDAEDEVATEGSRPIALAVDSIRSFRPRSGELVGTRVTLRDGTHYPVKEMYDEVLGIVTGVLSTPANMSTKGAGPGELLPGQHADEDTKHRADPPPRGALEEDGGPGS